MIVRSLLIVYIHVSCETRVAVCCSVLRCSVLQCVACCSVLQYPVRRVVGITYLALQIGTAHWDCKLGLRI